MPSVSSVRQVRRPVVSDRFDEEVLAVMTESIEENVKCAYSTSRTGLSKGTRINTVTYFLKIGGKVTGKGK
jgi:hypothetical protein